MRVKIWPVTAACAAAAIALCAAFFALHQQPFSAASHAQNAAFSAGPSAHVDPASTLFPELSGMHITALTVSTPERSFQFHMDTGGAVSVNGQQADSEIFSTLLEQIRELPVERHPAFTPQSQKLILTLVVSNGQEKQTARFYEDGSDGAKAHIVLGTGDTPEYRQTNGWRVGTLMMTCEGTRIQDIHGNETPVVK